MISSTGVPSESWAWNKAGQYKIKQTYPCYCSRNQESDLPRAWQWTKSSKFTAYGLFVDLALLVYLTMTLRILGECRLVDLTDAREQQVSQLSTQLRGGKQQERTAPPESPPPSYDETMKHTDRTETRI